MIELATPPTAEEVVVERIARIRVAAPQRRWQSVEQVEQQTWLRDSAAENERAGVPVEFRNRFPFAKPERPMARVNWALRLDGRPGWCRK